MKIYEIEKYNNEIKDFSRRIDISPFEHKSFFIAGACGLVFSYLIDTLLSNKDFDVDIYALTRGNKDSSRFQNDRRLHLIFGDVAEPKTFENLSIHFDFIINGASIVDPKGYKERPIDTMVINLFGTKNLLDLAVKNNATFMLASSCEIYGITNSNKMSENNYGIIDPLDVRSCYNESKKAAETLAICYSEEKGIKTLIARLSRTFGPTQSLSDTKALSQFLYNSIDGKDVVLNSDGTQLFSYTYVQDVVGGILTILKNGESKNAYNICNNEILELKQIASIVANCGNVNVCFNVGIDNFGKNAYSRSKIAIQDQSKLNSIGWECNFPIKKAIEQTFEILKELKR